MTTKASGTLYLHQRISKDTVTTQLSYVQNPTKITTMKLDSFTLSPVRSSFRP